MGIGKKMLTERQRAIILVYGEQNEIESGGLQQLNSLN